MRFNFAAYAEMNPKPEMKQVVTSNVKTEDVMIEPSKEDETGGQENGDSGLGESDTE